MSYENGQKSGSAHRRCYHGRRAAIGLMMMPKKKKHSAQKAAGRAIKAVGEVVEHFNGSLKM